MKDSKLIILLKALSRLEMKDLGRFIENNTKDAKTMNAFFVYLKKYHPEFIDKKIDREYVAKKIFGKEVNQLKKIENLMYKLVQFTEEFLIQGVLENDETERDFLLLKAYKKKKLDKFFFNKIEKIEKSWHKKPIAGLEHLHNIYRLKKTHFEHPNYPKDKEASNKLVVLEQALDKYYLAIKLYLKLSGDNTSNYIKETNTTEIIAIEPILQTIQKEDFEIEPKINLLWNIFKEYNDDEESQYSEIKEAFINNYHLYSNTEQTEICTFLSEICYKHYKKGAVNALQNLFDIKCFEVKHKFFLENGYISSDSFQSIVNIAIAANQIEWCEKFIEENGRFLQEKECLDTTKLCSARIHLYKKEYTEVLYKLGTLNFQNHLYGVQARGLLLQAYYELEDYEEMFFNLTKSFSIFLYRNKDLGENIKKAFSNFINFSKKLLKAKEEYKSDISIIEQEIKSCTEIVYKGWLLEKLQEQKSNVKI